MRTNTLTAVGGGFLARVRHATHAVAAVLRQPPVLLGLALIVAIWLAVLQQDRRERDGAQRALVQDTASLARVFEENVIRAIAEVDKVLLFLRHTHQRDGNRHGWPEIIREAYAVSDLTLQISIIDATGTLIANSATPGKVKPMDLSDREHFRVHRERAEDRIFISRPVLGRLSRKWSVQLTRRLSGPNGAFAGVIVASLDPGYLSRFYDTVDIGQGAVVLLGTDGVVRAAGGVGAPRLGRDLASTPLGLALARGEIEGSMRTGKATRSDPAQDGSAREQRVEAEPLTESVVSFRRVRDLPLHVAVTAEEAPAFAAADRVRVLAFSLAGLLSMVVATAIWLGWRHATRLEAARGELARSEARAQRKARELELTLEHMSQGILMVDSSGQVAVLNRRAVELLELPEAFLASRPSYATLVEHLEAAGEFAEAAAMLDRTVLEYIRSPATSRPVPHYERRRPNGDVVEVRSQSLPDGGFVRTFTDITSRRRTERRIVHLARHDALTDLANRTLFRKELEAAMQAIPAGRMFAVHYLDLDRFKSVNDTLGHPVGDKLLRVVAERLRQAVRSCDLVARLGGDEFAIIQMEVERRSDAAALASRIVDLVGRPFTVDGHQIQIATSIGIGVAPEDGTDPDELMKLADMALYSAKASGRSTWRFFEPDMRVTIEARRQIEMDLRGALAGDELELHFQPLFALAEEHLTGFEALLRWRKPGRGLVSPMEFIPIAEEIGLIVPIGAWVLEAACREALNWPAHLRVAVNLSPVQFQNGDIVETVAGVLARTGLAAGRLELEITESTLMDKGGDTKSRLEELHRLGVRISMDDFGTGYSSLSYLRSFPFDKIKIDRSFVGEICEKGGDAAIVRTIIALAESLGMSTTAEGIETEDQKHFLRALGCTEAQGYLFSKPRPAIELQAMLERAGSEATEAMRIERSSVTDAREAA
jgi:diguanylate cyclase (GGDEF)-like protein